MKPWSKILSLLFFLFVFGLLGLRASTTESGGGTPAAAAQGFRFWQGPCFPVALSDPCRTARSTWGR
jgi:hypothetical protein